jgi:hypothetical protein
MLDVEPRSHLMDASPASAPDWSAAAAGEWTRSLTLAMRGATQVWSQPILPGWTFNINSNNSTAPQTEVGVLQHYSYGRQLGRVSDALFALVETLVPEAKREDKEGPYEPFMTMKRHVDELKSAAAAERIDQLRADLLLIKAGDRTEYERLRKSLMRAFDLK